MKRHLNAAEGVFIIVIFLTITVCSGRYIAEETLPAPEKIIAKNIEAMGGKEALKKIKNKKTIIFHKFVQMNIESKSTEYKERPNNYYLSIEGGSRYGSNGKIAWEINRHGEARLFEGNELSARLYGSKFDQPDVIYKSMKTEGIEQINGKDCYKVIKTPEKGTEKIVYYDKKTYMIVKEVNYFKHPQLGNVRGETYIEGYKKINNILFPSKVVSFSNGQKIEEFTNEKIELNIEMPEGIFEIPEEVKASRNKNETEPHGQL